MGGIWIFSGTMHLMLTQRSVPGKWGGGGEKKMRRTSENRVADNNKMMLHLNDSTP